MLILFLLFMNNARFKTRYHFEDKRPGGTGGLLYSLERLYLKTIDNQSIRDSGWPFSDEYFC